MMLRRIVSLVLFAILVASCGVIPIGSGGYKVGTVYITSHQNGDTVQGLVTISGNFTGDINAVSVELGHQQESAEIDPETRSWSLEIDFDGDILGGILSITARGYAGGGTQVSVTSVDILNDITLNTPSTYPIANKTVPIRVFAAFNPSDGNSDPANTEFTEYIETAAGVQIIWDDVVPQWEAWDRAFLRISANDLPDLFTSQTLFSANDIAGLADDGVIQPLGALIDSHAPALKAILTANASVLEQLAMPDDEIYALPAFEGDCYHCTMSRKMWVYQPWLDDLALSAPQTTAEFEAMLNAFATLDPNGNGSADEIPFLSSAGAWNGNPLEFLMNSFIYTDRMSFLKVDTDVVSFVADTAEWRQGLTYIRGLVSNGLVSSDTFALSRGEVMDIVEHSGVPVVGAFTAGWYGVFTENGGDGYYADYQPLPPLEGPEGVRFSTYTPMPISYQVTVTNQAMFPEAIVQFYDWFYESAENQELAFNYHIKDIEYRDLTTEELGLGLVGRDNTPAQFMPLESYVSYPPTRGWWRMYPSWRPTSYMAMLPEWETDPTKQEYRLMEATRDFMEDYKPDSVLPVNYVFSSSDQAELDDLYSILDIVQQYAVEFILGDRDISSDTEWNAYVDDLQNAGVGRYVELWQIAVSSM